MAVLRKLFALLVSRSMLSIVNTLRNLIEHRLKPGVSSETKEEKTWEGSTREDSFQLVSIFKALTLQLLSI